MDAIELAALPEETPLVAALVTMQSRRQSGAVSVGSNRSLTLVTPRDVVLALRAGGNTLADIEAGQPVTSHLVPMEKMSIGKSKNWAVSAEVGGTLEKRGELVISHSPDRTKLLNHFAQGHEYTVSSLGIGRVVIVTSSERFAAILQMTVPSYVCSCSKEFHDFDLNPPNCYEHGCPVLRNPV